jgi:hypothetical protein
VIIAKEPQKVVVGGSTVKLLEGFAQLADIYMGVLDSVEAVGAVVFMSVYGVVAHPIFN